MKYTAGSFKRILSTTSNHLATMHMQYACIIYYNVKLFTYVYHHYQENMVERLSPYILLTYHNT